MTKALSNIFILFGFLMLFFITQYSYVSAHPGGTASDGMHNCWTNCSYWGEVYGQRHGHGYTPSYTPTYTPTYTAPTFVSTYKSNSDCPSYGFAYMGDCYELPDNAKKSFSSGFTCNYGYEAVGYGLSKKCLAEVDNGYRIGTSIYCNYGYERYYSSCLKESSNSNSYSGTTNLDAYSFTDDVDLYYGKEFTSYYWYNSDENIIEKQRISSQCKASGEDKADKPYFRENKECYYCDPGSITDQDEESCYQMADVCEAVYGHGSVPVTDGKCECSTGHSMVSGQCVEDENTKSNTSTTNSGGATTADLQKQLDELLKLIAQLESQM